MVRKMKKTTTEATEAAKHLRDSKDETEGKTAFGDRVEEVSGGKAKEDELMVKLREAEKRAAENYDKYLRAVAELDNYRKRSVRDKEEAIRFGNETLLKDILPLVDNVDRALEHACNSVDFDAFREGLKMLQGQLLGCLQKHGVETIEAIGKDFDPHIHEAMLQVESNEHEESKVVGEFEKGYLLNGRLLRPAKVSVCRRTKRNDNRQC